MVGALRGWSHYGEHTASDHEGPETPGHVSFEDFPHKQPYSPADYDADDNGGSPHHFAPGSSNLHAPMLGGLSPGAGSLLRSTSNVLKRVPGAQRASLLQSYVLGGCGLAAAAAAWLGGAVLLVVLFARFYLPVYEYHHSLPLFFDYSIGHAAAGAYTPLLRRTPLTASLTPPSAHPSSLGGAAAGAGLSFKGLLAPGSSFSVGSSGGWGGSSSGSSSGGLFSSGIFQQGGFLGLGVSPADRRRGGSSSSGGGSSSSSSGVDVGAGVMVPDGDWLMPLHGRMRLAVELELPGWPEADLVQVTTEVISQQGIILRRSTRTWIPQPPPLVIRLGRLLILGPWQALGLVSSNTKVSLPMFDGFQNPAPPPGGWAAVRHLLDPQSSSSDTQQQQQQQQAPGSGVNNAEGNNVKDVAVTGPRAMWLRVTVIGRSAGWGPPRIYRAAAKITLHVGLLDRIAAALRPSLPLLLLLLSLCTSLAFGGAAAAVLLLLAAYYIHSWSSSIKPEDAFSLSSLDSLLMGDQRQQQQQGDGGYDDGGDGYSSAGVSSPRMLAGSPRADSSFELIHDREPAEMSRFAREEMATRQLSPASAADPFGDGASYDDDDADVMTQQQQQPGRPGSTSSSSLAGGAVTAMRRMFGSSKDSGSSSAAAPAAGASSSVGSHYSSGTAGGVQRGWGLEAAAAEGDFIHASGAGPHAGRVHEWQEELLRHSEGEEDEEDEQAGGVESAADSAAGAGLRSRLGFPLKM